MQNITFHPLHTSHFPLLVTWLNEQHVQRWWPHNEPWTIESVQKKYNSYTHGYKVVNGAQKPIHAFIITVDEQPIGYAQYYNAYDFPRDKGYLSTNLFPVNLAALDFFIGDPAYLGKGRGAELLKTFLDEYIWKNFDACFVDPETENIAALKTYQKAGFVIVQQQDTATWMVATKSANSQIHKLLSTPEEIIIDENLVSRLISSQFPQWKNLPIKPVKTSGWDNRTFHLGDTMLVRMPSAEEYAESVLKEQQWLPKLAPLLPLPIPVPLAMGKPAEYYPWNWSIYRWIEGETVASACLSGQITDLCGVAKILAQFLNALQRIDSTGGPLPVWRGGSLSMYDAEMRQAIADLKDTIDVTAATEIWETALATSWHGAPVWVHGDISAGNMLLHNGQLSAIIDFGGIVVGDPACDLAIAWTLFEGESRKLFHSLLPLDADTWKRGRAWTLWKALITAAGFADPNNFESAQCWRIINEVLVDYKRNKL